jgi:glyoxylase-like metal-dependent hydrolase (beta-lactamase superfamily II)
MNVKITFLNTGFCTSLKKLALSTARWQCSDFPATFALIQHPIHGVILFDTGHSERFVTCTNTFPLRLYRWLIRVKHVDAWSAKQQLAARCIHAEEVNYIVISHFHADHIGGLKDFPNAKFIYLRAAYDEVKDLSGFAGLRAGFLPGLIPDDFVMRSQFVKDSDMLALPPAYFPFTTGYKLFTDESIIAVYLPGHAHGQIGLFVHSAEQIFFLVADACWTTSSYTNMIPPHALAFMTMPDKGEYMHTLGLLNALKTTSPQIEIIPSHCSMMWEKHGSNSSDIQIQK